MTSKMIMVRLADQLIQVECLFPETVEFLKGYVSNEDNVPELLVKIDPGEIRSEQARSDEERVKEKLKQVVWSNPYLEQLAIYRKIAEQMPLKDTVLYHGSCIAVDGVGYLFTAKSGVGKSTHARLWRELLGNRAVMVNDDKPLLKITDDEVLAFGTPWNGKHHLSTNLSVPLKAICIVRRGEINEIREIDPVSKYPTLLQQMYRPADPKAMVASMHLLDKLLENCRIYELRCNISQDAARVSWEAMGKE